MMETLPSDGPLRGAALLVVLMAMAALARSHEADKASVRGFSEEASAYFGVDQGEEPNERAPSSLLLSGKIDLNGADQGTLMALPGIGPALAARIIDDREERGPFRSPDELIRVKGIGKKTFERLEPYLLDGPAADRSEAIP